MIDFACQHCDRELRADDKHAGKKARCPRCSKSTPIPLPVSAGSAEDTANSQDNVDEFESDDGSATGSGQGRPAPSNDLTATLPPQDNIGEGSGNADRTPPPRDPSENNKSNTATLPPDGMHPQTRAAPNETISIPGFQILNELGRGGMGVIYKAQQLKPRRLVAIKVIISGELADSDQIARFRSEAEAVARMQHPNIVHIHQVSQHNGRPYLTLEYVDGGSLSEYLKNNILTPQQAAQLTYQLAKGMHYAHRRGIIHRDLKPANILLSKLDEPNRDDVPWIPKIADFGLAKQLEGMTSIKAQGPQTQSGTILGTPSYMAPEQAQGKISLASLRH